jgi:hypothetical protein
MKKLGILLLLVAIIISCKNDKNLSIKDFKTGTFETFLDNSDATSTATRNKFLQIETYNSKKDTFEIKWKSNFEYILTKIHPKSKLDSTRFFIKITGVKGNSYTFKANYEGSNFKQIGTVTKISE